MKWLKHFASRRWMITSIAIVIIVLAGSIAYQDTHKTVAPEYATAAANLGNISQAITISGTIEPVTNLELSFGSTGLVNKVNVQPGQSVTKGTTMATLNTMPLQAQVAQAQASVAADEAKLSSDEAGPTSSSIQSAQAQVANAQNALAIAQQSLTDTQATNQITITQSQVAVNQAQMTLTNDQFTLITNQQSFTADQKLVIPSSNATLQTPPQQTSPTSFDLPTTQNFLLADQAYIPIDQQSLTEAQATLSSCTSNACSSGVQAWISADNTAISAAQAVVSQANKVIGDINQLQNAQNSLTAAQLKASQSVTAAQQSITSDQLALTNAQNAQAVANQPATSSQIQSDRASLAAAQASLQSANEALSEATIVAPVDGVVAAVNISVGHSPSASTSTTSGDIVLESPNSFEVSGEISDTQISQVHLNQLASIIPAGQTTPLTGTVSQITPMATTTQGVATFPVNVLITEHSSNLFAGASAQVSIIVNQVKNVLTIPTSAIHSLGAISFVDVFQHGKSVRKLVTTGATSGIRTEITSGLQLGDQVIIANKKAGLPSTNLPPGAARGGFGAGGFARAGGFRG